MAFLKMLFFDHLQNEQPSLQQHAFSIYDENDIKVSKQAIDKRFNDKAVDFIKKLFENFLSYSLDNKALPSELSKAFSAIRIMDSTEFKLPANLAKEFPGYGGDGTDACAAIQFEYDIFSSQVKCLSLENGRLSDKTYADSRMENIQKGELILRDLGYYSIDSYEKIETRGGFYISRLKAQVSIYGKTEEGYEQLNWSEIIEWIKESNEKYFDRVVYIGSEHKKPVRLMAWLLDEEAQKKRLGQKKKRKGKEKINKQDEIWSQLNVFIANIPFTAITAQQAYNLYKIRWQIELIFKIWKSILKINLIRKMKGARVKCYMYSKLLWVLLSWDISAGFEPIIWKGNKKLISPYKCYALLKNKVEQLKAILFDSREKLKEWLHKMLKGFTGFGLKENRINRISLQELLQIK